MVDKYCTTPHGVARHAYVRVSLAVSLVVFALFLFASLPPENGVSFLMKVVDGGGRRVCVFGPEKPKSAHGCVATSRLFLARHGWRERLEFVGGGCR